MRVLAASPTKRYLLHIRGVSYERSFSDEVASWASSGSSDPVSPFATTKREYSDFMVQKILARALVQNDVEFVEDNEKG